MTQNADTVRAIRERDAAYGDSIPEHWTAIVDRRCLLRLLDEASPNARSEP
jgi:hypothetical protein